MLIEILKKIPDPRDPQGREYYLHDVLYISALAILANAKGYLDIHRFMTVHFESLKSVLSLKWRQVPNPSAIRKIIIRVPLEDIEKAFREHAQELLNSQAPTSTSPCHLCVDGKALRGSFSHTLDKRAQQVFNAFDAGSHLVLAHVGMENKESEIPTLQSLLLTLNLKGTFITADAIHCQKKLLNVQKLQEPT